MFWIILISILLLIILAIYFARGTPLGHDQPQRRRFWLGLTIMFNRNLKKLTQMQFWMCF